MHTIILVAVIALLLYAGHRMNKLGEQDREIRRKNQLKQVKTWQEIE